MAGTPFEFKTLWYRAHRLEELYPKPLDLSKSSSHEESFEILEEREELFRYLYHRAMKDLIYVEKRYYIYVLWYPPNHTMITGTVRMLKRAGSTWRKSSRGLEQTS